MTLLLHCGYHKTASSYLQSCFACRKDLLLKHGIFYPDDPNQAKAAKGIPTAGNGSQLCQALLKLNAEACRKYLRGYAAEAKAGGAESVLLSTEGFFTCFSRLEATRMFAEVVKAEGLDAVRAIIFFRAPVEHAISVYCHRAASGTMAPYGPWLEKRFETPAMMDSFVEHLGEAQIEWDFRKFQPKIDNIAQVVLGDWLQIREGLDLESLPSQVNVSVSIGEAELLAKLGKAIPKCGRYVSDALKRVPAKNKADEAALRRSYERLGAEYFQRHLGMLEKINRLLPANHQLSILQVAGEAIPAPAPVFSEAQVVACAEGMRAFQRSRTVAGRFRRFLKRLGKKLGW